MVSRVFGETDIPIPKPVKTFEQAFVDYPEILQEIRKQGFKSPSPIQCQAWPVLLQGMDLIGISQTGSGKLILSDIFHSSSQLFQYILFALCWRSCDLINLFTHIQEKHWLFCCQLSFISKANLFRGPKEMVRISSFWLPPENWLFRLTRKSRSTPTRESNGWYQQAQLSLLVFTETCLFVDSLCVYGGGSRKEQSKVLDTGVEILIATPGRLNDFVQAGNAIF